MTTTEKHERLRALAHRRQQTRWEGFHTISEYHDGALECDFVSPYTKGANNVDADLFILLQDWTSDESLRKPVSEASLLLGRRDALPTNKTLQHLLKKHFGMELSQTYATNLFPLIKKKGMSAPIEKAWMLKAASEFALPQIEIVSPKLVVCLGLATFNAVRSAAGHVSVKNFQEGMDSPFTFNQSVVQLQAHTGARGQNNRKGPKGRRDENRVESDWEKMAREFRQRNGQVQGET